MTEPVEPTITFPCPRCGQATAPAEGELCSVCAELPGPEDGTPGGGGARPEPLNVPFSGRTVHNAIMQGRVIE